MFLVSALVFLIGTLVFLVSALALLIGTLALLVGTLALLVGALFARRDKDPVLVSPAQPGVVLAFECPLPQRQPQLEWRQLRRLLAFVPQVTQPVDGEDVGHHLPQGIVDYVV